jgi:ankyrin repeat protein
VLGLKNKKGLSPTLLLPKLPKLQRAFHQQLQGGPRQTQQGGSTSDSGGGALALFAMIREGDSARLDRLLLQGVNPQVVDSDGLNPLLLAVTLQREGCVDALLRSIHGAQLLKGADSDGDTGLTRACYVGHQGITRALLKHGASMTAQGKGGMSALHIALRKHNNQIVVELLNHAATSPHMRDGALMALVDAEQNSPMHVALLESMFEPSLLKLLLGLSGDKAYAVDRPNAKGFTLLHLCSRANADGALKIFLPHAQASAINRPKDDGFTCLHLAAENNNIGVAKLLIGAGADISCRTKREGDTPLHRALHNNNEGVAVVLLEGGAGVTETSGDYGFTPMHLACAQSSSAAVRAMLRNHTAARSIPKHHTYDPCMMLRKMSHVIDWNAQDRDGDTPLHIALMQLLKHQTDAHAQLLRALLGRAGTGGSEAQQIVIWICGQGKTDLDLKNKRGHSPRALIAALPVQVRAQLPRQTNVDASTSTATAAFLRSVLQGAERSSARTGRPQANAGGGSADRAAVLQCAGCRTKPIRGPQYQCAVCADVIMCESCWRAHRQCVGRHPYMLCPESAGADSAHSAHGENIKLIVHKLKECKDALGQSDTSSGSGVGVTSRPSLSRSASNSRDLLFQLAASVPLGAVRGQLQQLDAEDFHSRHEYSSVVDPIESFFLTNDSIRVKVVEVSTRTDRCIV